MEEWSGRLGIAGYYRTIRPALIDETAALSACPIRSVSPALATASFT
jgi:hypothetical protein